MFRKNKTTTKKERDMDFPSKRNKIEKILPVQGKTSVTMEMFEFIDSVI